MLFEIFLDFFFQLDQSSAKLCNSVFSTTHYCSGNTISIFSMPFFFPRSLMLRLALMPKENLNPVTVVLHP